MLVESAVLEPVWLEPEEDRIESFRIHIEELREARCGFASRG